MALSDTELILQAQEGNALAFEELVYRYDKNVLSIALKYAGNEDDAKDIYQEVFIRIYKAIKRFRFESEFSTWVFRITTNVCLTFRSRENRRIKISLSYPEEDDPENQVANLRSEPGDQPDTRMDESEFSSRIGAALDQLSPKQKYCFTLKHFEGYKIREIAHMMGCREGTVKKYLFDAVRKLRDSIKEYSYDGVK